MRWEPECGWATFTTRWSVAGGAGIFLAVSAATATGTPGDAVPDVDSRDVRAIEIEPWVRADLARITEDAARDREAEQTAEDLAEDRVEADRGATERSDGDEPDRDRDDEDTDESDESDD